MQVHLKALGCRLNEAELEQWSRQLQRHGARPVDDPAVADLLVLNTCAVTQDAERKSRQQIRRLRRANPNAKLVVSGCYASLGGAGEATQLGADLVVDNADKDQLVGIAAAALKITPADNAEPGEPFARSRSRAFVKVQDGCRYRCSYCVVTLARGVERSRPVADIVAEVNRLHAAGVQEVVLTGVHLGGYGGDCGSSLSGLLAALLRDTDLPRLRLGSLEPWALGDAFFARFANPRLLPHLHLPLQSGSDRVLRRMARRGRAADFRRLAATARAAIADLNLSTDIIVGFPGETDADWQATLDLAAEVGFSRLHVFPFSPRAGTKAAALPEQVDRASKKRRAEQLHALNRRLHRAALARLIGRRVELLLEHKTTPLADGRLRHYGYTPNYLRAALDAPADSGNLRGQILPVLITGSGSADQVDADDLASAVPVAS